MNPKVFISYSHDSPEHDDRVLAFSNHLRADGIDTILDQYNPYPVEGWPRWMDTQIRDAHYVLMVCTETYYKRTMGEEIPGTGLGVRWEGNLIYQHIYDAGSMNARFIPILFADMETRHIPTPVKGVTHYASDTEEGYEDLYRRLTNQPKTTRPELGKIKAMPPRMRQTNFFPSWNIPSPRNSFFTGREEILTLLHARLFSGQSQVISGLGGMGKTQTAVEYAYRYRSEYGTILWARAESTESLASEFASLTTVLDLPEKNSPDQSLAIAAVQRWLEANEDWLLILDNADNPSLVDSFLPQNIMGQLLFTSRAQIFDVLGIAKPLELKQMAHQEAQKFLMTRTGCSDLDGVDAKALDELIGEFNGLPLALEQAGAYIVRMKSSFRNYLSAYRVRGLELLEKIQPVVGKYPKSVATTWLLNFEVVEKISPASADLLRVSAFLGPDKIPFELIGSGAVELGPTLCNALENVIEDHLVLDEVLEPLTQFSLISKDIQSQTFDIHRLVQTVIKDNLDETAQRIWAERAVKATAKTFPPVEFSTWGLCDRLLSHALISAGLIDRWRFKFEEAAYLFNRTGIYLIERARYSEAEPLYRKALEIREKIFGAEALPVAESLNNVATLYYFLGRYSEGESLGGRALDIRKKAYGTEHALVAVSLNNLGLLYNCQGKYYEAEPMYLMALEIREKIFGAEAPLVAESLANLASLYYAQGKYTDAETLYKRSIEIEKVVLGPDHPELATGLNNLALVYHVQGKYSEAESLYKRSLEIWEKTLGAEHPKIAASLSGLAVVYDAQGKYSEAEDLHKRSLEIWEKTVGPDHPEVASCLSCLGLLYHSQKKYAEAEPLLARALAIRQKILGPEHAEVARVLNNLGMLYHSQGKLPVAERAFKEAIAIFEKTLGSDHSEIATSLNNLAALYNALGDYTEAEPLYKRSIGVWEKSLGPEHPQVAIGFNNLGALYYAWGKYEVAEPFYMRAIKIWESKLGREHPTVATGLENIADLYVKMGKIEDAKEYKLKAEMIRMKEIRNT